MNVSSIGIQLVQSGTATQQKSSAGDSGGSNDRIAPAEPSRSSLPAGVGQNVDKTV